MNVNWVRGGFDDVNNDIMTLTSEERPMKWL